MNDKTNGGNTRDYSKEQPGPSDAARRSIAALGYGLCENSYGDAWALELNGFPHSNWMTCHQVEAFAAGIDRTLWHLGLDEVAYRVADRDEATDEYDETDKYDKTDSPCDHNDRCKTDKYDGVRDHCSCVANAKGRQHDVAQFHREFIEWADDVMDDMVRTFNLDRKEE